MWGGGGEFGGEEGGRGARRGPSVRAFLGGARPRCLSFDTSELTRQPLQTSYLQVINTVPVDGRTSLIRFAHVRNYGTWPLLRPLLDAIAARAMVAVLAEDKAVLDRLTMPAMDVSSRADKPQLAFRKLRKQARRPGAG